MNPLERFALTAAFVTCLPLCRLPADERSAMMAGLAKYLPAVGLLLGAVLAAASFLLDLMQVNNLLSGALLTLTWLVLTGGIHFDGLMDTADGIFSHRTPQRMLEIMNDSRVGNFGAMVGFGVVLLKFACLASLPPLPRLTCLLLVPAWARWCETFAIGAFPYLRERGMGKIWHDTTRFPGDLSIASIAPVAAATAGYLVGLRLIPVASMLTITAGTLAAFSIHKILKGHTGDTYGAVVELAETTSLLSVALLAAAPPAVALLRICCLI